MSSDPTELGFVKRTSLVPKRFGPLVVSADTQVGRRNNQEDRMVIAPEMYEGEYSFFGVFDGTVREYAADFVHKNIMDCLVQSRSFKQFHELGAEEKKKESNHQLLKDALKEMYQATDQKLLQWCRDNQNHYSSTTAVTALIHIPSRKVFLAHIGDSKIVLGTVIMKEPQPTKEGERPWGTLVGKSLTKDHKPNDAEERKRIEANGGSLTYLHGGKPFIRGGDFTKRKHAMQLNYSRAFGGKDLKMYGLSSEPDVSELQLGKNRERMLILASDGVWDVMRPNMAVRIAETAQQQSCSPAFELGLHALQAHVEHGSADNVSSIVCFFDFKWD